MNKKIRFEIMCMLESDWIASHVADRISEFMEEMLEIDCAIVVMDTEKEKEIY